MRSFNGFWRTAVPWVVVAVVCIELTLAGRLPYRYYNHEVDQLLVSQNFDKFNPGMVLIGDSIGKQILDPFKAAKPNRFGVLATNQAIEMPGHYYLIRRHLQRHRLPHAVVFIGKSPFGRTLDQGFTENYVQRCFTQWREIFELTVEKRSAVFGFKMLLYKIFPSYKHRNYLQLLMTGAANANPYSGLTRSRKAAAGGNDAGGHGIFEAIQKAIDSRRSMPIADVYFIRLLRFLQQRNVRLYYLPAPLPESAFGSQESRSAADLLKALRPQFGNLVFAEEFQMFLPDKRFIDGVHLDAVGLALVHQRLDDFLWDIQFQRLPGSGAAD